LYTEPRDFAHPELDHEVASISGRFAFTKEARLTAGGREVLYLTGYGVVDTSCCGTGGCGFALVPGFVVQWKHTTNESGLAVSKVEPVRDPGAQEGIRRLICDREMVSQVNFE